MAIPDLIADLAALKAPDRKLDVSIALATGYRRKVDESSGERKVTWYHETDQKTVVPKIPKFTQFIGAAYDLMNMACPGRDGGVVWTSEGGKATLDGAGTCVGANPAIALCIAVLTIIDRKG
ncbi:hypothetical protein [Sinorhizobium meliloti]|uniref:hypothetical protein n=1 Tax=Rhizobium meliloti TaxID=382 RepID=UPI0002861568|nr:hypothetical protein [Sinorhizobium meliloti]ASP79673.1 hypothetical protein CDO27_17950 [Sinorhizobium meliloti]MDW9644453.1 hypothetical protein [Sinorhizobium meliloti]MQW17305.1 hypothetical protein [Sinorhizobium meliloti]CCM66821.1 hypothetical protein BN406_00776 [Sinorhizobium meliloti Rm41]